MANDTTGNPWKIDTAGVITATPVLLKRMQWQPTTDGDDLLILDNGGSELWRHKALAASTNGEIVYEKEFHMPVNGVNVSVIDNGNLYIYIR